MASPLLWVAIAVCSVSLVLSAPSKTKLKRKGEMSKKTYDYYATPDPYYDYSGGSGYYDPNYGWNDPYDYSGGSGYYDPNYGWNDPYDYSGGSGYYDPYDYSGGSGYYDPYDYSGSSGWNDPYYDYSGSSEWQDPNYYLTPSPGVDYNWGSCGYGQMQCIDKYCVDVNQICDGMWACGKGEDELFCLDYVNGMMYYKKKATKRNMGKMDEKTLKMKVYNEVRNRHAKEKMIARKETKKGQRGRSQLRRTEDELKQLLMRKYKTEKRTHKL